MATANNNHNSNENNNYIRFDELADVELLALAIHFEARGEPLEGQVAVANVVINRMEKRKQTLKGVLLAPYQFSCFNAGESVHVKTLNEINPQIRALASLALAGLIKDVVEGADHYHSSNMKTFPSWSNSLTKTRWIANHIFYK